MVYGISRDTGRTVCIGLRRLPPVSYPAVDPSRQIRPEPSMDDTEGHRRSQGADLERGCKS